MADTAADSYVFLSYARRDRLFVDRLSSDLRRAGVNVWRDVDNILPGLRWDKEIKTGVLGSSVFLYVSSKNTAASEWMGAEVQAFVERVAYGWVIPIILDDEGESTLPRFLRQFQWIDFRENYDVAFSALLRGLPDYLRQPRPVEQKHPVSKGYVFISYAEEDSDFVTELRSFLQTKGYAYWDYAESERNYHGQYFLELEEKIREAAAIFSILSPAWKRSEWAVREYLFSNEIGTPVFLLKVIELGPTLPIAGRPFIDFTRNPQNGFARLDQELTRKGL